MQPEKRQADVGPIGESSRYPQLERERREIPAGDGELLNTVKVLATGS